MTMTLRTCDLAVFDGLSTVTIRGFEPAEDRVELDDGSTVDRNSGIDCPGSANWLVTEYGMQSDDFDPESRGILWTDYDYTPDGPWTFGVLIASDEVEDLSKLATGAGYEIAEVEAIAEPAVFGDGSGTVTIMKHPDGWVLAV